MFQSTIPVVCIHCGKGGEAGPLVRIGEEKPAKYKHKECQPHAVPTSGIPTMPLHNRPKLWIAGVRPPTLQEIQRGRTR